MQAAEDSALKRNYLSPFTQDIDDGVFDLGAVRHSNVARSPLEAFAMVLLLSKPAAAFHPLRAGVSQLPTSDPISFRAPILASTATHELQRRMSSGRMSEELALSDRSDSIQEDQEVANASSSQQANESSAVSGEIGNFADSTTQGAHSAETMELDAAREELIESLRPLKAGFRSTAEERREANSRVEAFVKRFGDLPGAQAGRLEGQWRLLYTDAPDILGLRGGPLSELDFIGQDIDETSGTCDNVIRYRPSDQMQSLFQGLGQDISEDRLEQRVLLSFEKKAGSNRVEQKIKGTKIVPLSLLGGRVTDAWAPPLGGTGFLSLPFGSYNLLYNDDKMRIVRTNTGLPQGYYAINERISDTLPAASAAGSAYKPPTHLVAGKTILITGANTGLGLESATRLAQAGAKVVLTARTQAKGDAAVDKVKAASPGADVLALVLDLASLESIQDFPAKYETAVGAPLDVLLANAGVMAIPERRTTTDGFERQVGVNHLGHFALISAMMPVLKQATDGFRVVCVSSSAHRIPNEKSMQDALSANLDPTYSAWGTYGISKASNVLFVNELQRRFDAAGLKASAVSLHPGVVNTDLGRYLTQGVDAAEAGEPQDENPIQKALLQAVSPISNVFLLTPEQGANTQVFLAAGGDSDGDLTRSGALYFENMKVASPASFTNSRKLAEQLWEVSEQLTGTKFDI